MNNEEKILDEIRKLHEKVDAMAVTLSALVQAKKDRAEAKKRKPKPAPLTQEEINSLQAKFKDLYSRWLNNQETAVQEELQIMNADDIRRFADANNLNVTAKTPKDRVIQLIGFRFREKKQLTPRLPA